MPSSQSLPVSICKPTFHQPGGSSIRSNDSKSVSSSHLFLIGSLCLHWEPADYHAKGPLHEMHAAPIVLRWWAIAAEVHGQPCSLTLTLYTLCSSPWPEDEHHC